MLGMRKTKGPGAAALAGLLAAVLAVGCASDGGGITDGGSGDDGGESASCLAPDTSCPEDNPPHTDGPCEGDLTCNYDTRMFTCESGEWNEVLCPSCAPQLFEMCGAPFDGTLDGVDVMLGPSAEGDFRQFEADEQVRPIIGGQGSSMIAYRLKLGDMDAPQCVLVRVRITIEGDEGPWNQHRVELHCGESLRIYEILPFAPCEDRDYQTTLEVDVDGVGTATANVLLEGGLCPG